MAGALPATAGFQGIGLSVLTALPARRPPPTIRAFLSLFSLEVTLGHESGLFYTLLEDTFYLSPGLNHKKAYQIGGHMFFL